MVSASEDPVSIRSAAKAVHKGQAFVRGLVESGEVVAIRDGGSDHLPRLKVRISDVKRAMASNVYVPKGLTRSEVARKKRKTWRGVKLHPAVADL